MSRFRVLVVDDEPLARDTVVDLVGADGACAVIAECGDGASALRAIREAHPDIVFLDVEMPELDGLRVSEALAGEDAPAIVYVTAYAQHAARAFDVAATDYLVKPFSDARFAIALARAKQRVRERRLGELVEQVAQLAEELSVAQLAEELSPDARSPLSAAPATAPTQGAPRSRRPPLDRLCIRTSTRSLVVRAEEIVWIESDDYYVRVHSAQGHHLLRASLDRLEERLDPQRFVRVHRKALVAIPEVRAIVDLFKGAREAVLSDGSRVRISRARWKALQPVLLPAP